jgi:hypothetical protein
MYFRSETQINGSTVALVRIIPYQKGLNSFKDFHDLDQALAIYSFT